MSVEILSIAAQLYEKSYLKWHLKIIGEWPNWSGWR